MIIYSVSLYMLVLVVRDILIQLFEYIVGPYRKEIYTTKLGASLSLIQSLYYMKKLLRTAHHVSRVAVYSSVITLLLHTISKWPSINVKKTDTHQIVCRTLLLHAISEWPSINVKNRHAPDCLPYAFTSCHFSMA